MNDDVPRLLCGTPELPPHCVALTFDDGPGPRSAELARLLRDEGVPGTFFVLGESLERHGDVLDTYRDCGHAIGLHGDRHRPFSSAEHAAGELGRCAERNPWLPGRHGVVPPAVRHGRLAGSRLRRPGRLACAGTGLGHHLPPRADGGRLRRCHRATTHRARRRHRAPARLRGGHRVHPGRPDRGRPGPADHRDHHTADRTAARCGTLLRRAARARAGPRAAATGPDPRRTGGGQAAAHDGGGSGGGRGAAPGGRSPSVPEAAPRDGQGIGRHPRSGHADTGRRRPSPVLRASRRGPELVLPGPGPARGCQVPAVWPAGPWPATTRAAAGHHGGDGAGLRRPDQDGAAVRALPSARLVTGREHRLRDRRGTRAPRSRRSGCSSSWTPIWPTATPWR